MAAHGIPYAASACACFPDDLRNKVREARKIKGMKYIHILSPCPSGWKYSEHLTPNVGRLAVETKLFPLYEIRDGSTCRITHTPRGLPVADYLRLQGRYGHLKEADIRMIQEEADRNFERLKARAHGRPNGFQCLET